MQPLTAIDALAVQAAGAAQAYAWPQIVTAVSAAIIALVAIGLGVYGYWLIRTLGRIMQSIERTVDHLEPRAAPLIDNAGRVAEDAREISYRIRYDLEEVHETVDDVNTRLRTAVDAVDRRVREFGAVADAVRQEAEELMLDAASTARGLHALAEELRRPRGGRGGAPRRAASDD